MMTDVDSFIMFYFVYGPKKSDEAQNSTIYLHAVLSQVSISNPIKSQHKKQQNSKISCAFSLLRSG
jgi:hypothetical protein